MPFRRVDNYVLEHGRQEFGIGQVLRRSEYYGVNYGGEHYLFNIDDYCDAQERAGRNPLPARVFVLASYDREKKVAVVTDVKKKDLIKEVMAAYHAQISSD